MRRSEVDSLIDGTFEFLRGQGFHLPEWGHWTPEQWREAGSDIDAIRDAKLGWDVTDFARGDFLKLGLVLFTIRNGVAGTPRNYCEKIMHLRDGQNAPLHYHEQKVEDIICRSGTLWLELFNARDDGTPDEMTPVTVPIDAIDRTFGPGEPLALVPGRSITLDRRVFHRFYSRAGEGPVMIGEVSKVNDDVGDNYFHPELPRFPEIEEDTPARYLLCGEY